VDSSGGLDIPFVNLLASDDDAVGWQALHGAQDIAESSPIDVIVIAELSSRPDTLLVLNDFTRLPSGVFRGSLHEVSLSFAKRLIGDDSSLQFLCDSLILRGVSGLETIKYNLRDCRLQFFGEPRTDQHIDGNMRVEIFGREANAD